MYVCRLNDRYLVKRMPDTGSPHHPDCNSYEPLAELSGLGEVASAIKASRPTAFARTEAG